MKCDDREMIITILPFHRHNIYDRPHCKLYIETLAVLRRGEIEESPAKTELPKSEVVSESYYLDFEKAPRLRVLRWVSTPGRHAIPRKPLTNFGAAEEAMKFLHWTRN